jgi:hypothetical protein
MNLFLILDIYLVQILILSPSVGVVGLVEYFCTHPCYLCCSVEDPDFIAEDIE